MRIGLEEGVIYLHHVSLARLEFLLEEGGQVHLADKAYTLGVLFLGRRQVCLPGQGPDFALEHVPDGE